MGEPSDRSCSYFLLSKIILTASSLVAMQTIDLNQANYIGKPSYGLCEDVLPNQAFQL